MVVEKVTTEGAELYCERRGTGPLLLLIAGGLGDAGEYASAADTLADEFTVVTYDRRCNSRSTGDRAADTVVAQQARDAAAIIEAQARDKALVFGHSGGGIIALELAAIRPDLIDFLVVHEAPVIELLPDVEKWRRFVDDISAKTEREGAMAAMIAFASELTMEPGATPPPEFFQRSMGNIEFFFKHEYRPLTLYTPDLERIRDNGVRMVMACGLGSGDAYYARATRVLAEKLGCEYAEFPGHHNVSLDAPKEFAKALKDVLERRKA
jgi:pimeloyl-ACP methyl ester carboxylesterase